MKNLYITVILLLASSYSFAANLLDSAANAARNVVDSTVGAVRRATDRTESALHRHSDGQTVIEEHHKVVKEVPVNGDHPHMRKVTETYKQVKTIE